MFLSLEFYNLNLFRISSFAFRIYHTHTGLNELNSEKRLIDLV